MWDYAGDNYVHRLIQSKTDGKLVELNSHCTHASDGCGSCDCVDSGFSEALLNSRVEAVMNLLPLRLSCWTKVERSWQVRQPDASMFLLRASRFGVVK